MSLSWQGPPCCPVCHMTVNADCLYQRHIVSCPDCLTTRCRRDDPECKVCTGEYRENPETMYSKSIWNHKRAMAWLDHNRGEHRPGISEERRRELGMEFSLRYCASDPRSDYDWRFEHAVLTLEWWEEGRQDMTVISADELERSREMEENPPCGTRYYRELEAASGKSEPSRPLRAIMDTPSFEPPRPSRALRNEVPAEPPRPSRAQQEMPFRPRPSIPSRASRPENETPFERPHARPDFAASRGFERPTPSLISRASNASHAPRASGAIPVPQAEEPAESRRPSIDIPKRGPSESRRPSFDLPERPPSVLRRPSLDIPESPLSEAPRHSFDSPAERFPRMPRPPSVRDFPEDEDTF